MRESTARIIANELLILNNLLANYFDATDKTNYNGDTYRKLVTKGRRDAGSRF